MLAEEILHASIGGDGCIETITSVEFETLIPTKEVPFGSSRLFPKSASER